MNNYTGRCIGIITDVHSLLVPTIACLEDLKNKGITEIYSLGDNFGVGPSPKEVMDLLNEYNVKSIAGNSEDYIALGIAPFRSFFTHEKEESYLWTLSNLSSYEIGIIKLYPHFIDLTLGGKKIALCHFANDIRWDYFGENSTWAYHGNFKRGKTSKQFLYTNSKEAKLKIKEAIEGKSLSNPRIAGYLDALNNPIFEGKRVTDYDAILQGHVHFNLSDRLFTTKIETLRAVGMGQTKKDLDTACYYVLKEKCDGTFDIEKRLVDFNKNVMLANIVSSDIPHKEKILRFVR